MAFLSINESKIYPRRKGYTFMIPSRNFPARDNSLSFSKNAIETESKAQKEIKLITMMSMSTNKIDKGKEENEGKKKRERRIRLNPCFSHDPLADDANECTGSCPRYAQSRFISNPNTFSSVGFLVYYSPRPTSAFPLTNRRVSLFSLVAAQFPS